MGLPSFEEYMTKIHDENERMGLNKIVQRIKNDPDYEKKQMNVINKCN